MISYDGFHVFFFMIFMNPSSSYKSRTDLIKVITYDRFVNIE